MNARLLNPGRDAFSQASAINENRRRLDCRSGWSGISAFETGLGAAFCDEAMADAIRAAIRAELNRRRERLLAMGEQEHERS